MSSTRRSIGEGWEHLIISILGLNTAGNPKLVNPSIIRLNPVGTSASFYWLGHMRGSWLLLAKKPHFLIAVRSQTPGYPLISQDEGYFSPISLQKLLKRAKMGLKAPAWRDGQGEQQLFAIRPSTRRTPGTSWGARGLQLGRDTFEEEVFARELDADQTKSPRKSTQSQDWDERRIETKRWQDSWK